MFSVVCIYNLHVVVFINCLQAAASHAAGAPVITQPGVTSAGAMAALGMGHPASIAGLPPHLAASVGTPVMSAMGGVPGMHQALQGGIPTPMAGLTQLSAAGSPASAGLLAMQQQQQQQLQQHPHQQPSPTMLQQLQGLQQSASPAQQHLLLSGQDFHIKKEEENKGYVLLNFIILPLLNHTVLFDTSGCFDSL